MANPILFAPTGTTLTTGQLRAEAAFSPGNNSGHYYWLVTGYKQLEFDFIRRDNRIGRDENLFGLQWEYLPETIITPAVSFGLSDIASQSAEGIGPYVAITRHLHIGEKSPILRDCALTLGIGAVGIRGPFFGSEMKLPYNLFAEGEYDSQDFNGAIGWQPNDRFRVKAYTIRGDFFLGAELVPVSF